VSETELTERQTEILRFIHDHCERNGYPPTVREIGSAVGLASPSTVHAHLAKLESAGHIRRDPTKPRAMLVRLPGGSEPAQAAEEAPRGLPVLGQVAAGAPKLAEEDVEEWVDAPFGADFLLRVTGDSMVMAGILDGDLVAVRQQASAEDGQIVVAMIEDEATVKRLRLRDGVAELHPENPAYEPIISDRTVVVGRVVGVLRNL
jgi:repressor LexA